MEDAGVQKEYWMILVIDRDARRVVADLLSEQTPRNMSEKLDQQDPPQVHLIGSWRTDTERSALLKKWDATEDWLFGTKI